MDQAATIQSGNITSKASETLRQYSAMGAEQSTPVQAAPEAEKQQEPQNASQDGSKSVSSALVICGPSGVGKGTLVKRLMEAGNHYGFSVSHTTRKPREGEQVSMMIRVYRCGSNLSCYEATVHPCLLACPWGSLPPRPCSVMRPCPLGGCLRPHPAARRALLLHYQGKLCQGDRGGQVSGVCRGAWQPVWHERWRRAASAQPGVCLWEAGASPAGGQLLRTTCLGCTGKWWESVAAALTAAMITCQTGAAAGQACTLNAGHPRGAPPRGIPEGHALRALAQGTPPPSEGQSIIAPSLNH